MLSEQQLAEIAAAGPQTGRWIFTESVPSAVTTGWGVAWNEELTSRDLLQNFRDANQDRLSMVKATAKNRNVTLFGPAEFNLKRLYFLGSEKSADAGDIGAYGEGFKAACLALLRDFNAVPVVVSGASAVHVRVGEAVEGTDLKPLVYDYYELETKVEGTWMIVLGCTSVLESELLRGMEHFFWDGHPALGELVLAGKRLSIYRSKDGNGLGFYRGLRRLVAPKVPFIFVLNNVEKSLENKVKQDRDRKAFAEAVAAAYYKAVARDLSAETVRDLLVGMKPLWQAGHPLLSEMASSAPGWHGESVQARMSSVRAMFGDLFPKDRYYAKEQTTHWNADIARTDRDMRSSGRIALPHYFIYFGVESAGVVHEVEKERQIESVRSAENTTPTEAEFECIKVLNRAIVALEGREIAAILGGRGFKYLVAHTDAILGMLRGDRGYRSSEVVLAANIFAMRFSTALSTLLHEYAHVFGGDGSRLFTDALTHIIECVIEQRRLIEPFEVEWAKASTRVMKERGGDGDDVRVRLLAAPLDGLHALISRAPVGVLAALESGEWPERAGDSGTETLGGGDATEFPAGSLGDLIANQFVDLLGKAGSLNAQGALAFNQSGELTVSGDVGHRSDGRGAKEVVHYVELNDGTWDVVRMDLAHQSGAPVSVSGHEYLYDGHADAVSLSVASEAVQQGLGVEGVRRSCGVRSTVAALVIERLLAEIRVFIGGPDDTQAVAEVMGLRYIEPGVFVADTRSVE